MRLRRRGMLRGGLSWSGRWMGLACGLAVALGAVAAWGQESTPTPAAPAASDFSPADNAWMLTSSALVLFMTAPGLALFYGGLVRKKNVLSVMMQCVFLMCMLSVVWALWGYSIAFGGGSENPWGGNFEYLFMRNVERYWDAETGQVVTPVEGSIPRLTHMLFQGMFFLITPALICGAFAERMRFSAMALFLLLWGTFIYCPLAHWVWDGGILAYGSSSAWAGGALDFAGGTVVHISSGVSALVCALLIGKRLGLGTEPMPPHNLTYTTIGAAMLWFGWFGFNAGSALNASGLAAAAFAATHFAAAAGGLGWALMEWMVRGKPTVLGTSSGIVAGLVCITPASGFVTPMPAVLMGLAAGVVCFLACTSLKNRFGYDDSLDAFGVHGVGGTLGAVLTGVFATRATTDPAVSSGQPVGLIDGNVSLLAGQIVAVIVTWLLAAVGSFALLKLVDTVIGLRVTPESEVQGLDLSEHGEEGYIFL
ncbi:MAG: ammonium transporter [Pirellulaceae bacterium]|nr:MAG: ammonium transporter [Pirellulaceae bacterium]